VVLGIVIDSPGFGAARYTAQIIDTHRERKGSEMDILILTIFRISNE
jgi:hypothetical protein